MIFFFIIGSRPHDNLRANIKKFKKVITGFPVNLQISNFSQQFFVTRCLSLQRLMFHITVYRLFLYTWDGLYFVPCLSQ